MQGAGQGVEVHVLNLQIIAHGGAQVLGVVDIEAHQGLAVVAHVLKGLELGIGAHGQGALGLIGGQLGQLYILVGNVLLHQQVVGAVLVQGLHGGVELLGELGALGQADGIGLLGVGGGEGQDHHFVGVGLHQLLGGQGIHHHAVHATVEQLHAAGSDRLEAADCGIGVSIAHQCVAGGALLYRDLGGSQGVSGGPVGGTVGGGRAAFCHRGRAAGGGFVGVVAASGAGGQQTEGQNCGQAEGGQLLTFHSAFSPIPCVPCVGFFDVLIIHHIHKNAIFIHSSKHTKKKGRSHAAPPFCPIREEFNPW